MLANTIHASILFSHLEQELKSNVMLQITISQDNGMHHKTLGSLFTYVTCAQGSARFLVFGEKLLSRNRCYPATRLQVTKIYCWITQNNQFISLITESSDLTKLKNQK